MPTQHPFLDQLQKVPLLCDGGMGTELYAHGISYEHCFEQLNLTDPELIKRIHLDYVAAGAQIIETNTFGANRYRLAEHGLEKSVAEINRAGAKLAREVRDLSEAPIFLAGNVGPLGSPLAPLGTIQPVDAFAAFQEQAEALLKAGVDLFLLETFSDLTEMVEALRAVRSLTDLPIVALMTFGEDGTVASGEDAHAVAITLGDLGADVVGANCTLGPSSMLDIVAVMSQAVAGSCFVAAQPNAGLPKRVGNRFLYLTTPDYVAMYARRYLDVGVKLVGGCCGTTPQHIAAINTMLADYAPSRTVSPASQSLKAAVEAVHERADAVHHDHVHDVVDGVMQDQADAPSAFARHVQQKSFMISVEMSPPRSVKYTRFLQNALYIRDCGADVINITDNAMAHVRMSNIAAARLIQQHLGIETIAHFTPRDRNLMAVQSDLIGAHATGIATILAVTGDPPHHGDFPNATGIWDVDSIGLISIMHNLNQGLDARGRKLAVPASFCIGCAANPAATDIDLDLERLNRKIEQGAQFIMTQPVFDADVLLHYIVLYEQRYGKIPLPILMGLQPLHSYQQAEKFHHEVPGIVIPEAVRARMQQAGSAGGEEGVAISKEIFEQALPVIQGVYIMPLDRFALVGELLPFIRQRTQVSVSTHTESN